MGDPGKDKDRVRYPKRIAQQAEPQAPTPGKSTQVQLAPASSGVLYTGSTLMSPDKHQRKTDNDFIDNGVACDEGEKGSECFLDDGQRSRMITTYQARVTAAQQQFVAALIELRIEELLKKDPEEANILFELFLDVIGMVAVSAAVKAFHILSKGSTETVTDVVKQGTDLAAHMSTTSESGLTEAIGATVAIGKKAVPKEHVATDKALNVGYLDRLKDDSALIYETLREGAIAGVDDATLLVLFDSFHAPNGHRVSDYKTALERKMQRFNKSGVKQMGVSLPAPKFGLQEWKEYETKAFWVVTPIGRRLGFYKREYHEKNADYGRATSGLRDQQPELPFVFAGYVPEEFESAAISMHTVRWGEAPVEHAAGVHETLQMGAKL